jgi:pimeloyl-ACP methyl ester carboxylesterase
MDERRFRDAEAALFEEAGVRPREHWIDLPFAGARARVLEVGTGEPVLFVHGGPMAGSVWAHVAGRLRGVRALLLDRPGCGLSTPPQRVPDAETLPTYVERLTLEVLDALGISHAAVVGSSLGGYSALRSAMAAPDRVRAVYLAGYPPFVPGWTQIPFFTLLRAPVLGRVLVSLPATAASARLGLRQMGEAQALRSGTIPSALLEWNVAWQRDTDTMRNDARMIRACGSFRLGFDSSLDLTPAQLARVVVPVHVLVGSADVIGGAAVGAALAETLPEAELEVWEGAGHLPWLGDADAMARSLHQFLARVSA